MGPRAPIAIGAMLLTSALLLGACGSGGGGSPAPAPPPAPAPAPPADPQPATPGAPAPEDPRDVPATDPGSGPRPVAGRTLWSYGAGAPEEAGQVTAAVDAAGEVVLGFHEGAGPSVFTLRRVGADGRQRWSRTMGAPGCDTAGRVLGVAPDGTIFIDLASGCDLPGFGPMARGDGARFALDADGRPLRAVHGGRDPSVVTTDGTLVALVALAPPDTLLFAYGADGKPRWTREGAYADVMRPTEDGGFVLAANRPPPVYPARAPHVTRYRSDGSVAWSRELPGGFVVEDAAVLDDGTTALAGFAVGAVSWAGRDVGGVFGVPTLLTVAATGRPDSARNLEDGRPAVAALPGGALAVVTRGGCDRLWVYERSLERRWERPVEAGCRTQTVGLLGAPARQLAAFGVYSGTADLGAGHATTAPGPQDAFLGAFAP